MSFKFGLDAVNEETADVHPLTTIHKMMLMHTRLAERNFFIVKICWFALYMNVDTDVTRSMKQPHWNKSEKQVSKESS